MWVSGNFGSNYGLREKKLCLFFAIPPNFFKWRKNGQKTFLSACHLFQ